MDSSSRTYLFTSATVHIAVRTSVAQNLFDMWRLFLRTAWGWRARGSFAPLQISHGNHWSYLWLVWTKAFSSTVLCSPARTLWTALGCYFAKYTLLFTFFERTHYCVSIACNGARVPVVKELRLPSLSLGEICPIYQFELCLSLAVVDENSF